MVYVDRHFVETFHLK